jgi:exopolysaccharide biosynthesis operon protein EpsL
MKQLPGSAKTLLGVLLGSLYTLPAAAQISDTIQPFVGVSIQHDSNLLRQDTDQYPGGDFADTYKTAQAGFTLERPIGRQLLTGTARVTRVDYDHFNELDYTGKDGKLDLAWLVGSHVTGHVGASYSEALGAFNDFHSSELNLRTDKSVYGNINWKFHPEWQVHTGYKREVFAFDLASQQYNNRTETTTDAGADYLLKNGSSVGLLFRHIKGDYPVTFVGGGTVYDNNFVSNEANLNVSWAYSAISQVTFIGGWVRRNYVLGDARDSSGGHGRLVANWAPLSHVQFGASLWREFVAAEGVYVHGAMATGQSLNVTWTPTAKIELEANLQNERRAFNAQPGIVNPLGLSDRTRSATLGVNYAVLRQVTLGLNVGRFTRDGSVAVQTTTYRSNTVGFSASVKF